MSAEKWKKSPPYRDLKHAPFGYIHLYIHPALPLDRPLLSSNIGRGDLNPCSRTGMDKAFTGKLKFS